MKLILTPNNINDIYQQLSNIFKKDTDRFITLQVKDISPTYFQSLVTAGEAYLKYYKNLNIDIFVSSNTYSAVKLAYLISVIDEIEFL